MEAGKEKWQLKESEESTFLEGAPKRRERPAQQILNEPQMGRPQVSCTADIKNDVENERSKFASRIMRLPHLHSLLSTKGGGC